MRISIITVCYNSEKTIADTFRSVLQQTHRDYEYIVVDGKSSDKTLQIIQDYKEEFAKKNICFTWVSEKDKGLFDAINKGISMAKGEVIGILNSDDILATPEAFEKISSTFEKNGCDAVYSDLVIMDYETMQKPNRVFIAGRGNYKLGWYPPHPTLYVKREVYEKFGKYSLKYNIAADYDFMVRIMKNNISMSYIPETLVHMRMGGVSTNSLKAYKKSFDQSISILKENKLKFPYCVNILRTVVLGKQRLQSLSMKNKKAAEKM